MYIVTTTFVVDPAVHGAWYEFFVNKFVPTLAGHKVVFTRVLSQQSDGNYTYSLQVDADDIAHYQLITSSLMEQHHTFVKKLFGDNVLHFTTLLKKIEL